jgi:hypothetical protein
MVRAEQQIVGSVFACSKTDTCMIPVNTGASLLLEAAWWEQQFEFRALHPKTSSGVQVV